MPQATFSIRMDQEVKRQFDELCREFGMNATTAFNIFAKAVIRERKIPFTVSAQSTNEPFSTSGSAAFRTLRMQAEQNGLADLSLEEINQEIQKTRQGQ